MDLSDQLNAMDDDYDIQGGPIEPTDPEIEDDNFYFLGFPMNKIISGELSMDALEAYFNNGDFREIDGR